MPRYIDADELIVRLDEIVDEEEILYNQYNADWIYSFIEEAPTADVQEVIHGKWKPKKVMVKTPYARNYYCSECEQETHFCGNYCPNCGARMDGDK